MTDIVERLRDQGKDAFSRYYSLGTFKLCDEAASEIERLRKALTDILEANKDFRDGMPQSWEGDPLQDACDAAAKLLPLVCGEPETTGDGK